MILHIVSASPYAHPALNECLEVIAPDDYLLLIEDGVYGASIGSPLSARLVQVPCQRFVLAPDLAARGLPERALPEFTPIDHSRWVQLVAETEKSITWYQ